MKKALTILLTLLAVLLVFVSCDNSVDYPFDDDSSARDKPETIALTLEFIKDGVITFENAPESLVFERNAGDKQKVVDGKISAEGGDRIHLYATRTSVEDGKYFTINCSKDCYIYGNVMSLISEDNYATKSDVFDSAFRALFKGNTHIKNHSQKKVVFPATFLAESCYMEMFQGCTGLTSVFDLPASIMAKDCYNSMFRGCTGLVTTPVLPSTAMAEGCYAYMFAGCTGLTAAPSLPASTLVKSCYEGMFSGCTGLRSTPALSATTLAEHCYEKMFSGCSGLTSVPDLSATTLEAYCYKEMFSGCTGLSSAPALPATILANYCYEGMFTGCRFASAPILPARTLKEGCYKDMFKNCTELVSIPTLYASTLVESCYAGMFSGCKKLNAITCLATAPMAVPTSTEGWVYDVASVGVFTRAESTTIWDISSNGIPEGWIIKDYSDTPIPLTLKFIKAGTLSIENYLPNNVSYSLNGGGTQRVTGDISVNANDTVYLYATRSSVDPEKLLKISCTSDCYVYGNIMSLIDATNFGSKTEIGFDYAFASLFEGNTHIKNHPMEELLLPATTLSVGCYQNMFKGCTGLTMAPVLGAATMADSCYEGMFSGCTGLKAAPELPATTLAVECYKNMFSGCTNLKAAPELPAEELADSCYAFMFEGCSSLTGVPELSAQTMKKNSYFGMFVDCISLRTAPDLPAKTLADYCYSSMFEGCTSLKSAPALSASVLAPNCYESMFEGCTSLSVAPELSAKSLAVSCYSLMFMDCTSLTSAPELPATTLADACYVAMFTGCSSLTSAPALPATKLAENCYAAMFKGCSSLTTAPELPATKLEKGCYEEMFYDCKNLNSITCPALDISAFDAVKDWVTGVASTGKFVKAAGMTRWTVGDDGIPEGWTVESDDENKAPLTLEFTAAGTITFTGRSADMWYSKDGGVTKTAITSDTLDVSAGDAISLYANRTAVENLSYLKISCSSDCYVYGNVMSLISADDFKTLKTIPAEFANAFNSLFKDNAKIKNHSYEKLVLPATTLTSGCYQDMFNGCTGLTITPVLPASTVASSCYEGMFSGCTGLTTAPVLSATTMEASCYKNMFNGCTGLVEVPELPAMSLATNCYQGMFAGCTKITDTPVLPATNLRNTCYSGMFEGCTSLKNVTSLPATTLQEYCYRNMFKGCKLLETAPVLSAQTMVRSCYEGMFEDCASLKSAPALPAVTLNEACYKAMFKGCTGLTSAPALPAETLSGSCYEEMFSGCTGITTSPVLNAKTLVGSCYSKMFEGCSSLNYIACSARALSATNATTGWVSGVASAGTFLKDKNANWGERGVNAIPANWTVYDDENNVPLTLEFIQDGKIAFANIPSTMTYSKNGSAREKVTGDINVVIGDKVQLFATRSSASEGTLLKINCSANCYVYGNVMSLVDENNYLIETTAFENAFNSLFKGNSRIQNHPTYKLLLPATTLATNCYYSMFEGCTGLTTAPELPATSLADACYYRMYYGCTGLTKAPELPATTLATDCYTMMFLGCTGLKTAPALPATTLMPYCYRYMFSGCTSLEIAPALPATTLTTRCYENMFYGCTGLTTAPELLATTLAEACYASMFSGCSELVNVPAELPATTLTKGCYQYMFSKCTGLTTAPELAATSLAEDCYLYMFRGCTNLTAAPVLPAEQLVKNCYSSMFKDCTKLNFITCLATDISASGATTEWVSGVASTGTFVQADGMTKWTTGNNGIPNGWNAYDEIFNTPLTLEFKQSGNITVYNAPAGKMWYSKNGGTKQPISYDIPVSAGDNVSFYADRKEVGSYSNVFKIDCNVDCYAYGNVMSLIDSEKFVSADTVYDYSFYCLFVNNVHLKNHETKELVLPATSLGVGCYEKMFLGCTNLTEAPALPAETLVEGCYNLMFRSCSGLTEAPVLPATTLATGCYQEMFKGCTSLTTAPELNASVLVGSCYLGMFSGCSSLTGAPVLPATTLGNSCYYSMFEGCTSLTMAPALPATTLATSCYREMFKGCTSLTTAPVLNASVLVDSCYYHMFEGCSSLNHITCRATDISVSSALNGWVDGVAATGTFLKSRGVAWPTDSINGIPTGWTVVDGTEPLTLQAINEGLITVNNVPEGMQYSRNGGEKQPLIPDGTGMARIQVSKDETISFYADRNSATPRLIIGDKGELTTPDCDYYVYGNVMSLIQSVGYEALSSVFGGAFSQLFYRNTHLKNHPEKELLLPATQLSDYCYSSMFSGCTSLVTAPVLPATSMAESCYESMFYNCTGLKEAPELPATSLSHRCYAYMFQNCTSLETAPALPATSLSTSCYLGMFMRCTSLIKAQDILPATTLFNECYRYMFLGCTKLEMAPELPAKVMENECYKGMFSGCESLATAPALPSKSVDYNCYEAMFENCTSLTTAPALPATTMYTECYMGMFKGCTGLTTAPVLPAAKLATNCYKNMFEGCTNLNYIICLGSPANNGTIGWVTGVAATGTFFKAPGTMWTTGTSGIPSGWTVIDGSEPLTLEFPGAGEIRITKTYSYDDHHYYYSRNGGTKEVLPASGVITVYSGDRISLYADRYRADELHIDCTADCYVYGNIMSLIRSTDYGSLDDLTYLTKIFQKLFQGNTHLKNHETYELVLPAKTLWDHCYEYMFEGCTGLTRTPNLPALKMAKHCYYGMFENCTGLTTAAELPALTMAEACYCAMFYGCTNLVNPPVLFATTLAEKCYYNMFHNCTKLETAPVLGAKSLVFACYGLMFDNCTSLKNITCLATDISASESTQYWVNGVASDGTFTKAASMTGWTTGTSGIPAGWTVVGQ